MLSSTFVLGSRSVDSSARSNTADGRGRVRIHCFAWDLLRRAHSGFGLELHCIPVRGVMAVRSHIGARLWNPGRALFLFEAIEQKSPSCSSHGGCFRHDINRGHACLLRALSDQRPSSARPSRRGEPRRPIPSRAVLDQPRIQCRRSFLYRPPGFDGQKSLHREPSMLKLLSRVLLAAFVFAAVSETRPSWTAPAM